MRKIVGLLAVLTLLVATSAPALAAGGPPPGKGPKTFVVSGTIASAVGDTITIQVADGNKPVKPYIGQELTIQTDSATRLLLMQPDSKPKPATIEELETGQVVRAQGTIAVAGDASTWTARWVRVLAAPE
jgi:hypothetical protein